MRVNERRVCEGVMPLRPVVGFLRPRSRSRRTCSTRSECWPRNASIPCRTGSRWTPSRLNSRSAKLSWESRVRLISGSGLAVALRPKQLVVEFTDALQGGLEFLVIAQPLLDEGLLFFGEADLLVAAAGIADGLFAFSPSLLPINALGSGDPNSTCPRRRHGRTCAADGPEMAIRETSLCRP